MVQFMGSQRIRHDLVTEQHGNLILKGTLCWKQIDHTKDNQPNNFRKLSNFYISIYIYKYHVNQIFPF